ncbi:MAG: hypothetical protein R3C27_04475 [Hyphomonadaceae bacterium]
MLQKPKQCRRRRVSFAQMAREIGPRLHTAYRKARVGLWRFKRSPKQQDRAAMVATFAFIGLFAVGSVDAIITGRADFAPGSAYAAEYTAARVAPRAPAVVAAVEEPKAEDATKTVSDANIDYSYTTETLLGGPELELLSTPLFEDALAESEKAEQLEPLASLDSGYLVF